jgi:F0F1-type ATP synthase membrane subunit c/vacuolar-type H+-ATPase subunit K
VNEMKSKLRKLRLIQFVMIAAIPMYGWIAESVLGRGSNDWTVWHWVMAALAVYAGVVGFFFRRKLMRRAEEVLANDASNPTAIKQWRAGQLVAMACAEGVVLWGVVVRFILGGALWQASLFYASGFFLLLLWTPMMPTKPVSD